MRPKTASTPGVCLSPHIGTRLGCSPGWRPGGTRDSEGDEYDGGGGAATAAAAAAPAECCGSSVSGGGAADDAADVESALSTRPRSVCA